MYGYLQYTIHPQSMSEPFARILSYGTYREEAKHEIKMETCRFSGKLLFDAAVN